MRQFVPEIVIACAYLFASVALALWFKAAWKHIPAPERRFHLGSVLIHIWLCWVVGAAYFSVCIMA